MRKIKGYRFRLNCGTYYMDAGMGHTKDKTKAHIYNSLLMQYGLLNYRSWGMKETGTWELLYE